MEGSIRQSGRGIPEETEGHICFFTSKLLFQLYLGLKLPRIDFYCDGIVVMDKVSNPFSSEKIIYQN